jgi:hypothetical protein
MNPFQIWAFLTYCAGRAARDLMTGAWMAAPRAKKAKDES